MDDVAVLRLMLDWGADEALCDQPVNRMVGAPAMSAMPILPIGPAAPSLSDIHSVSALYDSWAAFGGCPLRATATSTVRPSGTVGARVLLLGDAPSADDDRSGEAFSGTTGVIIDRVLASIGLDRSRVLLAQCIPWRPPGNRPPSDPEMRACLPFLHRLLRLSGATHVILMGQLSCRILLGTELRLSRLRGRWQDLVLPDGPPAMTALPMASAEGWLRTANSRQDAWNDCLLLRSTLDIIGAD